jgi:hypothetical protein
MERKDKSIKWYKTLSVNQRIELKECSNLICGIRWEDFTILFTPRQRIDILYQKLQLEGFLV